MNFSFARTPSGPTLSPNALTGTAPISAKALILATFALVSLSLVMVYSTRSLLDASTRGGEFMHFKKQVVWVLLGLVFMTAAACTDYQRMTRLAKPLMWFSLALLVLCYVPGIGLRVRDQARWIGFAGFTFQPSELAKLALVIYMADTLTRKREQLRSFTFGFLPAAAITGGFLILIVLEQDLGATVVLGLIIWLMWFVAGMRLTHLVSLLFAAIPAGTVFIMSAPWRIKRLIAFVNPEDHRGDFGLQLDQSLVAIGSGGPFGHGLGEGMQKVYFLPDGHTDFIFAHICEELGLIGGLCVLGIFATFTLIGVVTALRMPDFLGSLLACGLTLMLVVPAMMNIMVVTGMLPTKGLALPMVSYGGSQMLVNLTAVGILTNIVYHRQRTVDGRRRRRA